jgi:hypothetical protein
MILYTNKYRFPFEIDDADCESVSRYTWYLNGGGYPATAIRRVKDGTYVLAKSGVISFRNLRLHIFLLGNAPEGLVWDHRNRDKLDNRRENLRAVTRLVNRRNRGRWITNTSGVTGVYRRDGRWAALMYDRVGRGIWLGSFATLKEAAKVRKAAEARLWASVRVKRE